MTDNCKFKMKNNKTITTPSYYRLVLSDLLPKIDKILCLDGDILSFGNLKKVYCRYELLIL